MAFLCPVRIRRGKKKKPLGGSIDLDTKDALSLSGGLAGSNNSRIAAAAGAALHGAGGLSGSINSGNNAAGGGLGAMGRITGSASIETLVRVGIEKEHGLSPDSKMVVLHDFTPCVDDELEVKRGQCVNVLYRENDWVYVIGQDTRQEGFIPHSYCAPFSSTAQLAELKKTKLPRGAAGDAQLAAAAAASAATSSSTTTTATVVHQAAAGNDLLADCMHVQLPGGGGGDASAVDLLAAAAADDSTAGILGLQKSVKHSSQASLSSEPDFLLFAKEPGGRYIVLYTFIARDENDVSVERGEFVTVLNREDPEWYWIVRSDGQEGFIPSGFVYPADNVLHQQLLAQQELLEQQKALMQQQQQQQQQPNEPQQPQQQQQQQQQHQQQQQQHHHQLMMPQPHQPQQPQQQQQQHLTVATGGAMNSGSQLGSPTQTTLQQQQQQQQQATASVATVAAAAAAADDLRYHGTELVMLYDYKAQAPDDLSVRRGDWIYADLNNQTVDGWLWAYAPKTRKYGFIPKAYARPPAMTSL